MRHLGVRIWTEWEGMEIPGLGIQDIDDLEDAVIYVADGTWTQEHEDVMLGLARTIQQDGVGVNLSDSLRLAQTARLHHGFAAPSSEDLDDYSEVETDEDGRCMRFGYPVAHAMPRKVTWAYIFTED